MNYSDLQLRSKTFLDFTTDKAVIDEIIGDKEFFLSHIDDYSRMMTYVEFSELTSDKKLSQAIMQEFGLEYNSIFNE